MKFVKLFSLLLISSSLMLTSCGKDEDKGTCSDGIKNQDETGVDCGGICNACPEGAHGLWKSYPVAPVLAPFADSIIAEFKADNTYKVDSWKDGARTELTGTYAQTKSGVGNIYNIVLNQSTPSTLTSEGILELSVDENSMKYEVAQTSPAVTGVTPPTAAAGFGSTSGGAFGELNIQNYVRK